MLEGCQVRRAISNLAARRKHRMSLNTPFYTNCTCSEERQAVVPDKFVSVILCELKSQLVVTEIRRTWYSDSTGCSSSLKPIFSFRSLCENSVNPKWEKTQEKENNNKEEHSESVLQWVFQLWGAMWTDRGNLHWHTRTFVFQSVRTFSVEP